MGSLVGIVAGIAVIGGAVAVARAASRHLNDVKKAFNTQSSSDRKNEAILDFEKDPGTGVFKTKQ